MIMVIIISVYRSFHNSLANTILWQIALYLDSNLFMNSKLSNTPGIIETRFKKLCFELVLRITALVRFQVEWNFRVVYGDWC